MTKVRPEEVWAAQCLRLAMPGVDVLHHDDGSQGSMYDIDLFRNGHRFGICEVTSTTDGEAIASWNRLNGGDEVLLVDDLANSWLVEVRPIRQERRLKNDLPSILRLIEGLPFRDQQNWMQMCDLPQVDYLDQLGVTSLWCLTGGPPGRVHFTVFMGNHRQGGFVPQNGDELARWLSDWLAQSGQADNSLKLLSTKEAERHIFVIFPVLSHAPFQAVDVLCRDDGPLPTIDPDLPNGLTNVWAASLWSSGSVFGWSASQGWQRTPKPMAKARAAHSLELANE